MRASHGRQAAVRRLGEDPEAAGIAETPRGAARAGARIEELARSGAGKARDRLPDGMRDLTGRLAGLKPELAGARAALAQAPGLRWVKARPASRGLDPRQDRKAPEEERCCASH